MSRDIAMAYTVQKKRKVSLRELAYDKAPITFDKFYELAEESRKYDLIDGKVIREWPIGPPHGRIVCWLNCAIGLHIEQFNLGEVLGAPVAVRLSQYQGPEPDVFFISKARSHIIGEKYIDGPPDLCIKVISKSTRKLDRGRKLVLYADHGVQEYWIIDPLGNTIEIFENMSGEWRLIQPDEKQRLHSKVLPGFWLKAEWLIGETLPPVMPALQEILAERS